MDDSTMTNRNSSPLFMPQDEPEGNASPGKRGEEISSGNGNGDGMDTDMIDVKSGQDTSESQPNPQEPYAQGAESMTFWNGSNDRIGASTGFKTGPEVRDEQSHNPPPPLNTFTPINSPKPSPRSFSPLTSKAERKRRRAEKERADAANGQSNENVAPAALEASDPDTIVVAQRASPTASPYDAAATKTSSGPPNDALEISDDDGTIIVAQRRNPATRPASPHDAAAPKPSNGPPNDALETSDDDEDTIIVAQRRSPATKPTPPYDVAAPRTSIGPPNDALASFTLGNSSRESVGLRHLAARNTIVHKELSRQRLENATSYRAAIGANNPSPRAPQSTKKAAAALELLPGARHHLDVLQTTLRKEQDAACDREEHLTVLLEQAREIRKRAITDRKNGLVIIRDRKMKLEGLEKRLKNGEKVDHEEMLDMMELLKPLDLGVPVGMETFEKMKRDGRERGGGFTTHYQPQHQQQEQQPQRRPPHTLPQSTLAPPPPRKYGVLVVSMLVRLPRDVDEMASLLLRGGMDLNYGFGAAVDPGDVVQHGGGEI